LQQADPRAVPVAQCLARYYEHHASRLPSADQARIAIGQVLDVVGNAAVAELTPTLQDRLIASLTARGQNGSTISRVLSVLRAGVNWSYRQGELSAVPFVKDVPRPSSPRQAVGLDAIAAFRAAIREDYLETFLLLALGTAARKKAILELTRDMCDVDGRRISLNPHGRAQTNKRRPVIRMAESLVPLIRSVRFGPLVTYQGRPLDNIRAAWRRTRERAGLDPDFNPHSVRHTVATWLHAQDVPESQCAAFLGHKWSNRTTEGYIHARPDFQMEVTAAIDRLISEIGRVRTRPISD
jgi:integrase